MALKQETTTVQQQHYNKVICEIETKDERSMYTGMVHKEKNPIV